MLENPIEPSRTGSGRPAKYPWDTWFDGEEHVLEKGKDFFNHIETFRVTVLGRADKMGYKGEVRTSISKDGTQLTIQRKPNQ